jgi:carbohydrate-binding DOMON domain-containing protein
MRVYFLIAAMTVGFFAGWHVNGWRLNAQIQTMIAEQSQVVADANAKAAQNLRAAQTLGDQLTAALSQSQANAQAGTNLTIKRIAQHEKTTPTPCRPDAEWLRLYNTSLNPSTDNHD